MMQRKTEMEKILRKGELEQPMTIVHSLSIDRLPLTRNHTRMVTGKLNTRNWPEDGFAKIDLWNGEARTILHTLPKILG
jgi:hypothetical protein